MALRTLVLLAGAVAVSGCASDQAMRKSSGELALRIDQVSEDAEKFAVARDRVMKARVATLATLEANALSSEQSNQSQISYRVVAGDTAWVELVERLRQAPDLVAQQRKTQAAAAAASQAAVQNAKSAVDFKTAKLSEASKALALLAEEQSDKDVLAFYVGFVKEIQKSVSDKASKTEATTEAAASESEKKAASAKTSAGK